MINLLTYHNLNEHSDKIAHFSSTRNGGVSKGAFESLNLGLYTQDTPEKIEQNRQLLATKLGITTSQIYNAHQVHGTSVKVIDNSIIELSENDKRQALKGYDAFISNIPGTCITATTADCVPILLYDPVKNTIAAIHSGWRSTLDNIVQESIHALQQNYGTKSSDIIAAIGPCISQSVYEVGTDVFDAFSLKNFHVKSLFQQTENGKFLFDIRETVRLQLLAAGVKNMEVSTHCTYTAKELFFSARRQGNNSGRMLSGILLK